MTQELSANTHLSHYRIVSKLGAGGMGEVYLAIDTKLERRVALKTLPPEFAANQDRMRRFVQEAKAAAALNHPNIAHVYEIGESDGLHFIAMEYIEGVTLRDKIYRDREPLQKLLRYLIQVAEGLAKAHQAGIVHRDLKPDNIMITRDDYAKILDFGLAKLVEPHRAFGSSESNSSEIATAILRQQSIPGIVMGTVGYMSPEQASGRVNEIDHRSDIFSFGCLLFEAASGKKPFEGKDALDSLYKVVHMPAPLLKEANPFAPDELQRVVRRCLAKELDKRYQSMKEVAIEIDDLQHELKIQIGLEYRQPAATTIATVSGTTADEGFWVAVLPFKFRGSNVDLEALAEGLTEDIVTGLSRFSYLRVIARSSTLRFTSEAPDVRAVGKELGARYVMEGNLRLAGSMLRVAVQLVDASTGAHLWAETYDRPFRSEEIFALQDDIVPRIVSTVADAYGILPHSMSQAVRSKKSDLLTPYEAVLRSFSYIERVTAEEHADAKTALERAVQQAPGDSDCWAMLSILFTDEHIHGFSTKPDLLDQALNAARRAVDANPLNHRAYQALAWALCYRKEFDACKQAAERTVALNPLDAVAMAYVGQTIAYGGGWERGCELLHRAMQLNPHHPGWYWYAPFLNAYRQADYRGALDIALKMNMPGVSLVAAGLAAVYGQLGELEAARDVVRALLALRPDFRTAARTELEKLWDSELVDHLIDGLRKAGLDVAGDEEPAEPLHTRDASGERRAEEGFWVAVLPFKSTGTVVEVTALAEGLSEEIVTGLSRFSYLRVIGRGSTLRYANQTTDLRIIGKELGARYVIEGSLRQVGTKLRLAVQLVDATTGAHLWAENYERSFSPEAIFELQDDLVPRIVSTVADQYGALVHSMSESLRGRRAGQYSAHEAMLRAFGYWERMTPEEHAEVRDILEAAVAVAPDHSDCLAELAMIYWHEYAFGYNLKPDPIGRARAAAQRAVASAPTSHFANCALATSLFFQKDHLAFRPAAERALALNRMDSSTAAILGNMIAYSGDWEYGLGIVERAMQLNPHHGGWYHYVAFCDAYSKHDYRGALASALKVNMPTYHWPHVYLAAVYGQLGEQQRARTALRELDALMPNFGARAREELSKWLDAELTEHLLDGLRKAGLEIVDEERTPNASPAFHASGETRADEGFWVAVLPFKATGTNNELSTLAEGLSAEIVTGLSRFSYLRVIARSSTVRVTSEATDIRKVGKEIGARYVMEGNLRQAGTKLRLAVQLIDATSGVHLWAENYERSLSPEANFELQDDLVPRIVSTVADQYGALVHSMSESLRGRSAGQYSAHEAMLRLFGYLERMTPEEHCEVREILEAAVATAPGHSGCHAALSVIYWNEYANGYNVRPEPLGRALAAARQAVAVGPTNHLAHCNLATVLFFQKDFLAFRPAAERALALNTMDTSTTALLGTLIAYAGDWEYGLDVIERATQLNPHHPGWYHFPAFHYAYHRQDYRGALASVLKFNMPGYFFTHAALAAVYGQLGEQERARAALRELHALIPNFGALARQEFGKWVNAEQTEHLIDGLRKAGLKIADKEGEASRPLLSTERLETRTLPDLGGRPSIAVLPFANMSADSDQEYFSDGLAEEIINLLAHVSSLKVIARTSAFAFRGKEQDIRAIASALGVSTILQGSVRRAGDRLRVTAQLIDAADGAHLWAERFDRAMTEVFAVQDEIAAAIAGALKITLVDQAAAVRPYEPNLAAYEAFLKGRHHYYKFSPDAFTRAEHEFTRAIDLDPQWAEPHAALGDLYFALGFYGWRPLDEMDQMARDEARKAVAILPSHPLSHAVLAAVAALRDYDWQEAEAQFGAATASGSLDPTGSMLCAMFYLLAAGRFDEAAREMALAITQDPLNAFWRARQAWILLCGERYDEAIAEARKALEFDDTNYQARMMVALSLTFKGQLSEAQEEAEEVFRRAPWDALGTGLLAGLLAKAGERDRATHLIPTITGSGAAPVGMMMYHLVCEEIDAAIDWYQKDIELRRPNAPMIAFAGYLRPLRRHPRWPQIARMMNLPDWEGGKGRVGEGTQ